MNQSLSVTVTCEELMQLASCACRMTTYADPNSPCVISLLYTQSGIPVRLVLDRVCIRGADEADSEVITCSDFLKMRRLKSE